MSRVALGRDGELEGTGERTMRVGVVGIRRLWIIVLMRWIDAVGE